MGGSARFGLSSEVSVTEEGGVVVGGEVDVGLVSIEGEVNFSPDSVSVNVSGGNAVAQVSGSAEFGEHGLNSAEASIGREFDVEVAGVEVSAEPNVELSIDIERDDETGQISSIDQTLSLGVDGSVQAESTGAEGEENSIGVEGELDFVSFSLRREYDEETGELSGLSFSVGSDLISENNHGDGYNPGLSMEQISAMAVNNPDGPEADLVRALENGDMQAAAEAALNSDVIYPDAIIRTVVQGVVSDDTSEADIGGGEDGSEPSSGPSESPTGGSADDTGGDTPNVPPGDPYEDPYDDPDLRDPTDTGGPPPYDRDVPGPQPIVLDLDGDGIELSIGQGTFFDVDNDGFLEQGSWVSPDDGFLVIDLNEDGSRGEGDGIIDQSHELVWSLWGEEGDTDLQALQRAFDDNGDGVINNEDEVWSELNIWQDLNQNGATDDGELRSLDEWGISEINTVYDNGTGYNYEGDDVTVYGNTLHGFASYIHDGSVIPVEEGAQLDNGSYTVAGGVGDVSLQFNALGWRQVDTTEGYNLEFEGGVSLRFGVVSTNTNPDINLTSQNLDGAVGDDRRNLLTAAGHIAAVQISGGAGDDTINGGWGNDMLSGGDGADVVLGGQGDDVIFFDAEDIDVRGEEGMDIGVLQEFDVYDAEGNLVEAAQGVSIDMGITGFETLVGGDGADNITIATDHFRAINVNSGEGNDTVGGGQQDDVLSGGNGNDSIRANSGDDIVRGGEGADTLIGNDGDDLVLGGAGHDSLVGGQGDDILLGGADDDFLDGRKDDDLLVGGAGNDTLIGGIGDDYMVGGADADSLSGGEGDDFLSGGEGDDTLEGGEGDNFIQGGDGNDTIYLSAAGDNWVQGGDGDDRIYVPNNSGRNVVFGGVGDDRLMLDGVQSDFSFIRVQNGDTGVNQWLIRGLPGTNVSIVIQDIEGIIFGDGHIMPLIGLNEETDNSDNFIPNPDPSDMSSFGGAYGDLSTLPDWMFVQSNIAWQGHFHAGNDSVTGTGASADITLGSGNDTAVTGDGSDTIDGASGIDAIDGGENADSLLGGSGSDGLWGGAGDDVLEGGSGSDFISAGAGSDTLVGGSGSDTLLGGSEEDSLVGGYGGDILIAGDGDDSVFGNDGSDLIEGGSGSDELWGEEGSDRIDGGADNDSVYGGNGDDQLSGGEGDDLIQGDYGNDQINGDSGNDELYGGLGNDYIIAGDGNDLLLGNEHDDYLFGGFGADTLDGGNGSDFLEGGFGTDLINGGGGITDTASYASSNAAVQISLHDGTAAGGDAENDTLLNIEMLQGSRFGDNLTGDTQANLLSGERGDDRLFGHDGNDRLYGGFGADTLNGGLGNDVLVGDTINEILPSSGMYYEYISEGPDGSELGGILNMPNSTVDHSGFVNSLDVAEIATSHGDNTDHFGIRLHGVLEIDQAGDYQFQVAHDDNLRVLIDGEEVYFEAVASNTIGITLDAGITSIEFQYYQDTGPLNFSVNVRGPSADDTFSDLFDSGLLGNPYDNVHLQSQYADELNGGANNDYLVGGFGTDTLNGDAGTDTLSGGDGADLLTGGDGGDEFVFIDGFGSDTIADFNISETSDIIDLSRVVEIESFDDLMANHSSQVGADTVIEDGLGNSITLIGTQLTDLTADEFVF